MIKQVRFMVSLIRLTLSALLLSMSLLSFGREIRWSQEMTESRRLSYLKVLGASEGRIYTLRSDAPMAETVEEFSSRPRRFQVQCYSENLSLLWEKELQSPIDGASIFRISMLGSRILVLTHVKREGADVRDIYAQFLADDGSFAGIPVLVDEASFDRIDVDRLPYFTKSRDRSKWVIAYRMSNSGTAPHTVCGVVVDSTLNVLWRKEMTIDCTFRRFSLEHVLVMNDGSGFFLGRKFLTDKRVKSPGECNYQLYGYHPANDSLWKIDIQLNDKFLSDANLAADEVNHKAVMAGFYSEAGINSTAGIFSTTVSTDSLAQGPVHYAPFSNEILTRSIADRSDFRQRELYNYYVDRLLVRKDGGAVVVAESYVENTRTYWDYYTQSTISHTYYRYGNLLMASLDPEGSLSWDVVVQKEQSSMDDDGYQSSYCEILSGGAYHVVYNKYIDRRSSVMLTRIDGKGSSDTETLFGESDRIILLPRSARQVTADALVVPAYKQGRLYLLRISFP